MPLPAAQTGRPGFARAGTGAECSRSRNDLAIHRCHVQAVAAGSFGCSHLIAQRTQWAARMAGRACALAESDHSPELAVAGDQTVGRAVVLESRLGDALELWDDTLCQNLAEFHSPLIERVDVPDCALGKYAVLVKGNQVSQRRRRQAIEQNCVGGSIAFAHPV